MRYLKLYENFGLCENLNLVQRLAAINFIDDDFYRNIIESFDKWSESENIEKSNLSVLDGLLKTMVEYKLDPCKEIKIKNKNKSILEYIPFTFLNKYQVQKELIELNNRCYFIFKEWEWQQFELHPKIKKEYENGSLKTAFDFGLMESIEYEDRQPFYASKESAHLYLTQDIVDEICKREVVRKNGKYTSNTGLKIRFSINRDSQEFVINISFYKRSDQSKFFPNYDYYLGGICGSYILWAFTGDKLGKRSARNINNNFISYCYPIWSKIPKAYKRLENGEKFWDIVDEYLTLNPKEIKLLLSDKKDSMGNKFFGFCHNKKMEEKYKDFKYHKVHTQNSQASDLGLF